MDRVTVWHRTAPARLPAIEREGLRTRADLGATLGPLEAFDAAATGRFARGRRVSGWLTREAADARAAALGGALVSFSVDPRRATALPASVREADPAGAWAAARPLAEWLAEGREPADLEVHQDVPVRAKLLRLHAVTLDAGALGPYAPLVAAVADTDRLAAKLLVHVLLAVATGEADDPAFLAASALAWRDEPDDPRLPIEVARADLEAVVEAVLADEADAAPEAVATLTAALDALRAEAAEAGTTADDLIGERSTRTLERVAAAVAAGRDGVRG
jgi:plasmid stabilization system protein ParE